MDERTRSIEWNKWRRWVLWWQIDPLELREQVDSYATMNRLGTARGLACLLSLIFAVPWAFLAVSAYTTANNILNTWAYVASAYTIGYVVLGCLLLQGRCGAALGLMVLATAQMVSSTIICYYYMGVIAHYVLCIQLAVLGWSAYMHALYSALCVEKERRCCHAPS